MLCSVEDLNPYQLVAQLVEKLPRKYSIVGSSNQGSSSCSRRVSWV